MKKITAIIFGSFLLLASVAFAQSTPSMPPQEWEDESGQKEYPYKIFADFQVNSTGVITLQNLTITEVAVTVAGDAGVSQDISAGETLTIEGGNNITTTGVAGDRLRVALDDNVSLNGTLSAQGNIYQAGTLIASAGQVIESVIPGAITRDTEWNTITKIETATGANIIISTEINSEVALETLIGVNLAKMSDLTPTGVIANGSTALVTSDSIYDLSQTLVTASSTSAWDKLESDDIVSGDAAGGDLSGTYPNPSVQDNSHAHTGSTLSGIDVSDDTNLLAGYGLVLTGDTVSIDGNLTDDNVTLADVQAALSNDFHNVGGTDDDVPDAGDFGAGADLDADGHVDNDSHNHTTTTISGLDISADTNLAATNGVSLVDDTLSAVLGTNITAGEIADGDHGDFTYASGVANIDNGAVGQTEISTGGVGASEIATDAVGTDELDDDSNTPVDGALVIVETGGASFDYLNVPNLDTDSTDDFTAAQAHALIGKDLSAGSNITITPASGAYLIAASGSGSDTDWTESGNIITTDDNVRMSRNLSVDGNATLGNASTDKTRVVGNLTVSNSLSTTGDVEASDDIVAGDDVNVGDDIRLTGSSAAISTTASILTLASNGTNNLILDSSNNVNIDANNKVIAFQHAGSTVTNHWVDQNTDQYNLGLVSTYGYQLNIVPNGFLTGDYAHGFPANPTVSIHSATDPSSDPNQFLSLYHDQSNPTITWGSGDLSLKNTMVIDDEPQGVIMNGSLTVANVLRVGNTSGAVPYNVIDDDSTVSATSALMDAANDLYVEGDQEIGGSLTINAELTAKALFLENGVSLRGEDSDVLVGETITINQLNNVVGINNNAPSYALDVVGSVNTTGEFLVNGIPVSAGGDSIFTSDGTNISQNATVSGDNLVLDGDITVSKTGNVTMTLNSTNHLNTGLEMMRDGDVYYDYRMKVDSGYLQIQYSDDDGTTWNTIWEFQDATFNPVFYGDTVINGELTLTDGLNVSGSIVGTGSGPAELSGNLSISAGLTLQGGKAVIPDFNMCYTVNLPKSLSDSGTLHVMTNLSGYDMHLSRIYSQSSLDDTDFTLKETTGANYGSLTTIEAISVTTNGTGVYYNDLTSGIDHSVIENGNSIVFDNDAADNPKWTSFCLTGYLSND